jgi:signal transduction histidine kinase
MSEERGSLVLARALAESTSDPLTATVITELCDELEALLETQATIGFELHDGPLQSLGAVRLDVELFRMQIAGQVDGAAEDVPLLGRIADIEARLSALEAELRDVAVAKMDDPAAPSLTVLIAELADEAAADLRVELRLDPELDRIALAEPQRHALARVVGAAVANSARHSGASVVVVAVQLLSDNIEVEVVDAGAGFDVSGADSRAKSEGRLGLVGMAGRMRRLGGELRVKSAVGVGTSVHARLPLQ